LVGGALKDVKLSGSLLGNWPFAETWRLLLLAPLAGLVVGGAVAAHGAPPPHRWRYGALIAIPYTTIVLLTAILARLSVHLSVAALELDLAFGASLAWTLLVMPVAAGLGAAGALLARRGSIPAPHPRWVGITTAAVCGVLLLGTLPLLASSSSDVPAPDEILASQPGPTPNKSNVPLPDLKEPPSAPEDIPKPEFSPSPEPPERPDAPQNTPASAEQRFISKYYAAVAREDWNATYSMLDPPSRRKVSREEWIREQKARQDASDKPPIQSTQITQISEQGTSVVVTMEITHEDGTKTSLSGVKIHTVDGKVKRHLTRKELSNGSPL
jgi:outer membrane biosynthesis protein TonB